jgi:hypothetical protein
VNELVSGRRANAPGGIIQDDLGASHDLTSPIGMLLEWHERPPAGTLSDSPAILNLFGEVCSPFDIGVGPGAWFVTNLP